MASGSTKQHTLGNTPDNSTSKAFFMVLVYTSSMTYPACSVGLKYTDNVFRQAHVATEENSVVKELSVVKVEIMLKDTWGLV